MKGKERRKEKGIGGKAKEGRKKRRGVVGKEAEGGRSEKGSLLPSRQIFHDPPKVNGNAMLV